MRFLFSILIKLQRSELPSVHSTQAHLFLTSYTLHCVSKRGNRMMAWKKQHDRQIMTTNAEEDYSVVSKQDAL